mmetsp:Transcript_25522/g.19290  ORF Transcript_25522/g.19290 Transcript_25522/m.19290 type:complete len:84 (+) Transcript_25522:1294-1545(+)
MLAELPKLHPQKYPLRQLLDDFRAKVAAHPTFLLDFCDQLVADEKLYAIPRALTLWKHHAISKEFYDYFQQLEFEEYPFLNPK